MKVYVLSALAVLTVLVLAVNAPTALLVFGASGGVLVAFLLGREVGHDEARRNARETIRLSPGTRDVR